MDDKLWFNIVWVQDLRLEEGLSENIRLLYTSIKIDHLYSQIRKTKMHIMSKMDDRTNLSRRSCNQNKAFMLPYKG